MKLTPLPPRGCSDNSPRGGDLTVLCSFWFAQNKICGRSALEVVPDFALAVQYSTSGFRGGVETRRNRVWGVAFAAVGGSGGFECSRRKVSPQLWPPPPPSDFVAFHPFPLALQGFPFGFPLEVSSHQMWIRLTSKSAREKQWVVGDSF